uniref:NADH-ubiquinone oxidoreductase chain 4L n=1 Tax=Strigamia maritima TaxID=126957 RepID=A0A0C5B175_STRMM|nr:NADH dehydrogenase subunit 4L [Strigamia maritima]AJK90879.1 NADH dehydrogenase subunit 4L [Strigamia maritima]
MLFLVFCGGWLFVSRHSHLLVMLLGIEMVMLGVYGLGMSAYQLGEGVGLLMFLVFLVCEGSVGLSVLVCVVRSHGSEMLSGFSLLEC